MTFQQFGLKSIPQAKLYYEKSFRKCTTYNDDVYNNNNNFVHKYFSVNALVFAKMQKNLEYGFDFGCCIKLSIKSHFLKKLKKVHLIIFKVCMHF